MSGKNRMQISIKMSDLAKAPVPAPRLHTLPSAAAPSENELVANGANRPNPRPGSALDAHLHADRVVHEEAHAHLDAVAGQGNQLPAPEPAAPAPNNNRPFRNVHHERVIENPPPLQPQAPRRPSLIDTGNFVLDFNRAAGFYGVFAGILIGGTGTLAPKLPDGLVWVLTGIGIASGVAALVLMAYPIVKGYCDAPNRPGDNRDIKFKWCCSLLCCGNRRPEEPPAPGPNNV